MEQTYLIPPSINDNLPVMVRNELQKLSAQKQEEFVEEYRRKAKSIGTAYAFGVFFGTHYAYMRNWGMQALFWLTLGGIGIWWIIDLVRMPGLIRNFNKDSAVDILRNLKAISASSQ